MKLIKVELPASPFDSTWNLEDPEVAQFFSLEVNINIYRKLKGLPPLFEYLQFDSSTGQK